MNAYFFMPLFYKCWIPTVIFTKTYICGLIYIRGVFQIFCIFNLYSTCIGEYPHTHTYPSKTHAL